MDNRENYSYGWNQRGQRFYALKSGRRQGRVNMIAALCKGQLVAPFTLEGSCNRSSTRLSDAGPGSKVGTPRNLTSLSVSAMRSSMSCTWHPNRPGELLYYLILNKVFASLYCKPKAPQTSVGGLYGCKNNPGTELLSQAATRQLSSPQQRFTTEFGMGSEWFHRAIGTRKNSGQ